MCSDFEKYGKCKFGVFCDYNHSERNYDNLEINVDILKEKNW